MFFPRIIYLFYLILKHNCLFILGLISFFPFSLLQNLYDKTSVSQAKRLVKLLENAGPAFIKLGQLLSTRIDIFDEVFIKQLQLLKENTTKIDSKRYLESVISKESRQDPYKIFSEISDSPIACASIAQVYKAKLVTGEDVAIKVIKSKATKTLNRDIKLFSFIANFVERVSKQGRIQKPHKIVDTLKKLISFELDLRFEAAACTELEESLEDSNIILPKIYWQYSSKKILVSQWIEGGRITDHEFLAQHNINKKQLLKQFTKEFLHQILKAGYFHGDIHTGNIIITPNGKIALVDFGIMGRLSKRLRYQLGELFSSLLNKDYMKAAQIHFDLGWLDDKEQIPDFALACRSITEKLLIVNQSNISIAKLFEQLLSISGIFDMVIQEEVLLLQKNLVYMEYIGSQLCPDQNMWISTRNILKNIKYDVSLSEKSKILSQDIIDSMIETKKYAKHYFVAQQVRTHLLNQYLKLITFLIFAVTILIIIIAIK